MAKVEIRAYHPSDLNALLTVWEQSSRYAHPFLSEATINKVKADIPSLYIPNADTWVIIENEQLVGFVSLLAYVVGALFVKPSCHGKGYGKRLLNKACQLHSKLELDVYKDNSKARNFYRAYGFIEEREFFDDDSLQYVIKLSYQREKA